MEDSATKLNRKLPAAGQLAINRRFFISGALSSLPVAWSLMSNSSVPADTLPPAEMDFVRDMQQRCYQFFLDSAQPETGLVSDRVSTDGSWQSTYSSIAACGFALTSHSIAANQKWRERDAIASDVYRLLHTLVNQAEHKNGFLYHFLDKRSAKRALRSEASTIDTALLIAGAMTAAETFADYPNIVATVDELYRRVDWKWMLSPRNCLYMGWTPEEGVIQYQWDTYSELVILVLLAIGAPENNIPADAWQAWRRSPVLQFGSQSFLSYPPLFVHQYPMAYFDFRNVVSESGRSYWDNAVAAHHAQIEFMTELGLRYPERFSHYGDDFWGLTSSDSATGYRDWGGPYQTGRFEPDRGIDGTLVPSAAAGGLAAVPEQALHTLIRQKLTYGTQIYGKYGFANAHNPATGWVSRDVIGIDTGISLIMAENMLSGGVWDAFMRHDAAKRAFDLTGFRSVETES